MSKNSASILFGLGVNILLGILQITVKSMPTIVAIVGYIVGGALMLVGIIGFLRNRSKVDNYKGELREKDKIKVQCLIELSRAIVDIDSHFKNNMSVRLVQDKANTALRSYLEFCLIE